MLVGIHQPVGADATWVNHNSLYADIIIGYETPFVLAPLEPDEYIASRLPPFLDVETIFGVTLYHMVTPTHYFAKGPFAPRFEYRLWPTKYEFSPLHDGGVPKYYFNHKIPRNQTSVTDIVSYAHVVDGISKLDVPSYARWSKGGLPRG